MSCVRTDNRVAATDEPRTALVRQERPAQRAAAGAALLAIVLLAAACGSSGGADRAVDAPPVDASASSSPSPSPSTSPGPSAVATAASRAPAATVVQPEAGVLPRTMTYGTLDGR